MSNFLTFGKENPWIYPLMGPITAGTSYLGAKAWEAAGDPSLVPKIPDPPAPAAAPVVEDDSAAKAAAMAEADRLRKRKGIRGTLLTGPGGITTPPTTLKTVLG